MKKSFLFALMIGSAFLFSCGNKSNQTVEPAGAVEDSIVTSTPDASNARTSLDYKGTYKGLLPTASGSGMEVTIVLSDSTYTKDIVYVGEKEKLSSAGKYTWNEAGNTITLMGDEKPNQYEVGENTLTHLDIDGNKITGPIAPEYILKK